MKPYYNYKKNLILKDNLKGHKSYILKCFDDNKKINYICFEIYYFACAYHIYISGLNIEKIENGTITTFPTTKDIKLTMYNTTYKYSKKQFEKTENFMLLNLNNLIDTFCGMNTNIYVD